MKRETPRTVKELRTMLQQSTDEELARIIKRTTSSTVSGDLDSGEYDDSLWAWAQELMIEVERRKTCRGLECPVEGPKQ